MDEAARAPAGSASAYPFDGILVPVGPAPDADRALSVAVGLARRTGAPLRLLSVGWPVDVELVARRFWALPDAGGQPVEIESRVVGVGAVAATVTAATGPRTLVCMSSHGAYGPARTLAGTITEKVIRTSLAPVLLVGPRASQGDTLGAGRIAACVDSVRDDHATIATATRWAQAYGLPLCIAHVTADADPVLERSLHDVARILPGVDGWFVIHDRHPARALARLAATAAVALLVMAPAGRTGWARVLSGSVTTSTVRRVTVPVLAVPPRRPG